MFIETVKKMELGKTILLEKIALNLYCWTK